MNKKYSNQNVCVMNGRSHHRCETLITPCKRSVTRGRANRPSQNYIVVQPHSRQANLPIALKERQSTAMGNAHRKAIPPKQALKGRNQDVALSGLKELSFCIVGRCPTLLNYALSELFTPINLTAMSSTHYGVEGVVYHPIPELRFACSGLSIFIPYTGIFY